MLTGTFGRKGYDWWWHSFTAVNERTGEERAFFIEYFMCNPDLAEEKPVFGQLPENKRSGKRPSYVMVKAGCWGEEHVQLHRFFAWKDVKIRRHAPYAVKAGDCFASDFVLRGSVERSEEECRIHPEYMCDAGSMSWNLQLSKKVAFHVGYGASRLLREIKAFEMYWHAEGMKTLYRGTVTLNGEKYVVTPECSFGYADKNWGCGFTSPWVWLSSCCMTSKLTGKKLQNSVFDIGGGRPKVFFVPLDRKLLSAFWYEGREFEYNFSKFWMLPRTRFYCKEKKDQIIWYVNQDNYHSMIKTKFWCDKKDMLLVNYEAPDGSKRHNRLWNGGNGRGRIRLYEKRGRACTLIDDISVTHLGCEYGEYDSVAQKS